ncbi:molybdopterin-dependent oxidoreductase [Streptomyces lasalocidi]
MRAPVLLRKGFGLIQKLRPEHMTSFITPEADLFTVWHLGVPDVCADSWTLTVGGMVSRALTLSLEDLAGLPQTEITAVHECAGSPLAPTVPQRRVGNVRWGGVRLSELLHLAGIEEGAAYVISTGVDHGVYDGTHHQRYEKDLPLGKALDGSVLVALAVNGEALPVRRGGPLRLVVPGYYGTNSTKWLDSLTVSDRRSGSAFTTKYYMDRPENGSGSPSPVWELAPNSCLVSPSTETCTSANPSKYGDGPGPTNRSPPWRSRPTAAEPGTPPRSPRACSTDGRGSASRGRRPRSANT